MDRLLDIEDSLCNWGAGGARGNTTMVLLKKIADC